MIMSEELERFRRSLTDPITTREQLDSLDLSALEALGSVERHEAERLLIERLDTGDDPRVAAALERVDTARAVDALRKRLPSAADPLRGAIARALWRRTRDPAAAVALTEGIRSPDDQTRMAAARSLEDLPGEPFDRALLEAIDDTYWLVRINAISALWGKHHLQQWSQQIHRYPNLLRVRCLSGIPAVRRPAVAELSEVLELLRSGVAPPALGWTDEPLDSGPVTSFAGSLHAPAGGPEARGIDLEAFAQLAPGEEREFGEYSLVLRAEEGDARAFGVIESVRTGRLLVALHQLASSKLDGAERARQCLTGMARQASGQ